MSVERPLEDGMVRIAQAPRQFWPETTPTLGTTPVLPDEDLVSLAAKAREAARKIAACRRAAWEAEERATAS